MSSWFYNTSIENTTSTINEDPDVDVEIATQTTLTPTPPPSPSPHQEHQDIPTPSDIFNLGLIALEMKQINIPCLLISSIIIVCCMIACDILYRVVMNNMVHGTVRKFLMVNEDVNCKTNSDSLSLKMIV